MTIERKIEKYYSQLLDKETKRKINELNSNLYGIGIESEDFNFIQYAKDVSEKILELPEMYYNSFCDFWCDNLKDIEEEEYQDWYEIKLEDIKNVLLGTELANTI
jgi:hypothetical protein